MKRGQAIIIGIFLILVIVLGFSFYFYYFGFPKAEYATSGRTVVLIERESPIDNLLVPKELEVFAKIGQNNFNEFSVSNYNARSVSLSCNFPPFQPGVPSSRCFSYDSEGKFIGNGIVIVPPGGTYIFTAAVYPFESMDLQIDGSKFKIPALEPGMYKGEVELEVSFEGDEKKTVSMISIPVKIFVE